MPSEQARLFPSVVAYSFCICEQTNAMLTFYHVCDGDSSVDSYSLVGNFVFLLTLKNHLKHLISKASTATFFESAAFIVHASSTYNSPE